MPSLPSIARRVTIVVTVEGVGVVVVVVRTGNDPAPETSPPLPPVPARDQVAQLKDLADLKAEGIVINAEFRRPRGQHLGRPFRDLQVFEDCEAGRRYHSRVSLSRWPNVIGRERMWKLVSTVTGLLGGLVARKLIRAIYGAIRKDTAPVTPFDPTRSGFSWPDALLWAAAAGIGLATAKMVSARLTAIGWKAVTGTPPPGQVDEAPVV